MSFAHKLLAYSAAAGVVLGSSLMVTADQLKVTFDKKPLSSDEAKAVWKERTLDAEGVTEPYAAIAKAVGAGRELTVSILVAGNYCGVNDCWVRVVEDEAIISEFRGCANVSGYELAESMNAIMACGEVHVLPTK